MFAMKEYQAVEAVATEQVCDANSCEFWIAESWC